MPEGSNDSDYKRTVQQAMRRKEQIRRLEAELAQVRAERDQLSQELNTLGEQFDELTEGVEALEAAYKASPDENLRQLEELRGQLAERDHRDAWRKAARDLGLDEARADDAWTLAKYTPEGDPDPEGIKATLGELVKARPYLAGQAPNAGAEAAGAAGNAAGAAGGSRPALSKPPGSGRGATESRPNRLTISRADYRDPNKAPIVNKQAAEARKAGVEVVYTD